LTIQLFADRLDLLLFYHFLKSKILEKNYG
jgi:hypothetical protein